MVEAVLVVGANGRVVLTNRALDALTTEDVRGRRAKNVIKNPVLRRALRDARKADARSEVTIEATVLGLPRVFHAHVSPIPRGRGAVAVLHDVTAVRAAERLRRELVANASHELRTPLTAIRGFAETLVDGALDDRATTRRFLEAILRQTTRLERLAADLAALAAAEASEEPLATESLDVRALASDVLASLTPLAASRGIALRLQAPSRAVRARANARALEQVLSNLVENAIKYSPDGAKVVVAVRALARVTTIEVRDRGRGIAPEHHARIFERFYRVDEGRARTEGGTGLGLAIVRHLVARMSGRVSVESALGEGATFRVELPRTLRSVVTPPKRDG
jgi:two-component system phosphate regulon sensor histidine kinase PhoR